LTVTDEELEMVGVMGPKCAKIRFDDDMLMKQVTSAISLWWWLSY